MSGITRAPVHRNSKGKTSANDAMATKPENMRMVVDSLHPGESVLDVGRWRWRWCWTWMAVLAVILAVMLAGMLAGMMVLALAIARVLAGVLTYAGVSRGRGEWRRVAASGGVTDLREIR